MTEMMFQAEERHHQEREEASDKAACKVYANMHNIEGKVKQRVDLGNKKPGS
jgi:hypothetical protein